MGNFNRREGSGGRSHGGFGGSRDRGGFGGGRDRDGRGGDRPTMHNAVCNECGDNCQVPFRPTGNKPVLCSNCFRGSDNDNKRSFRSNNRREKPRARDINREMHNAVCDTCGEDCQVPFRPTGDKPIFCDNCFGKGDKNNGRGDKRSNTSNGDVSGQIKALNDKLDKLIDALLPKTAKKEIEKPTILEDEKPAKKEKVVKETVSIKDEKPAKKEKVVKEKVKKEKKAVKKKK